MGNVVAVTADVVPLSESEPHRVASDSLFVRYQFVKFSVREVIRGYFDGSSLTFGVSSRSDIAGSYGPGDTMVVSLSFNRTLRGGMFEVISNSGRFVLEGEMWHRSADYQPDMFVSLDEIRAVSAPLRLGNVAMAADVVAIGTIKSVKEERVAELHAGPQRDSSLVRRITFVAEDVIKGSAPGGPFEFTIFWGGSYYPVWANPGPRIVETDARHLVFLEDIDGSLYASFGINGFLTVGADGKLGRNQQLLPITITDVREMVARAK